MAVVSHRLTFAKQYEDRPAGARVVGADRVMGVEGPLLSLPQVRNPSTFFFLRKKGGRSSMSTRACVSPSTISHWPRCTYGSAPCRGLPQPADRRIGRRASKQNTALSSAKQQGAGGCRRAVAVAGVLAREAVSAGRTRRGVTGRHVELSRERVAGHHMEKQVGRGSTDDHTYARPCCRFSQTWWSH